MGSVLCRKHLTSLKEKLLQNLTNEFTDINAHMSALGWIERPLSLGMITGCLSSRL